MTRVRSLPAWLAVGALAGLALAANASGCGGGSGTGGRLGGEGDGAPDDGSSGAGGSGSSSGSGNSSSGGSSSSGGADAAGEDSGSSSGPDSGSASSSSSSGSSGGADSSSDSSTSSSSSGGGSDSGSDASSGSSSSGGADSGSDSSSDSSTSSSSSGGGDSGGEASVDAPGEAAPACPDDTACALGSNKGICVGGTCAACSGTGTSSACSTAYGDTGTSGYTCVAGSCTPGNCNTSADCTGADLGDLCTAHFCTGCTTDSQCKGDTTYGGLTICNTTTHACVSSSCTPAGSACSANSGDICCGGTPTCVPGNCCTNTQCSPSGATPACDPTNYTCGACDPLGGAATFVVVDPLNGSDTVGTGTGTVNGHPNGICAFRTIGFALQNLGSATGVHVLATGPVSVAGNGETFPIDVNEDGVTITGSAGTVTVSDIAADGTGTAFMVDGDGVVLSNLLIDGGSTGIHGIVATDNSTLASTLSSVEVSNFAESGIRVQGAGQITIGAGTNSHDNLIGLYVTGTGQAVITGNASGAPIQFSTNTQQGILVDMEGSVTITGSGAGGSVVTAGNGDAGVLIEQSDQTYLNTITGLLSQDNGSVATPGDGLRILANSAVQVRGSVFLGNYGNGVDIESTTGAGAGDNDVSGIDLGTDTGANAGGNALQDPTHINAGAGVCLNIAPSLSATLSAEGNIWNNLGATGLVNCAAAGNTLSLSLIVAGQRTCAGDDVDIGGSGLTSSLDANANGVEVDYCGCGGGPDNGTGTMCQ